MDMNALLKLNSKEGQVLQFKLNNVCFELQSDMRRKSNQFNASSLRTGQLSKFNVNSLYFNPT